MTAVTDTGSSAARARTVLLFGPQALSFQEDSLDFLREQISNSPSNAWVKAAVAELPQYATCYTTRIKRLQKSHVVENVQELAELLQPGRDSPARANLPNSILTSLVVLHHLAQFTKFIEADGTCATKLSSDEWLSKLKKTETVGFCSGQLSAAVVSSARNHIDFQVLGAVALRLAVLIGALVDAVDAEPLLGRSKSFSLLWNTPEQKQELDNVLASEPEAYASVYYDQSRLTVTTSTSSVERIQDRLRGVGSIVAEIALSGWFHCTTYADCIDEVLALCDQTPGLQLPSAADVQLPTYSTVEATKLQEGLLHHVVLREILLQTCQWYRTFKQATEASLQSESSRLVLFGQERCIPPSLRRHVHASITYMTSLRNEASTVIQPQPAAPTPAEDEIAVIGMAVKVAGADDPEELWDLMEQAQSQHRPVPEDRFTFDTAFRENDPKKKWFGNFMRDHDAFDHKFFRKSPRESATQDPQQRLFLQSAYQAVEQSGYFNQPNPDPRVGVFVGSCAADYEANIACYPPNAFSATGNLKSFIAGKISHYFGWTGPGLVIDTACSAAAVAVHQACRAIQTGECKAALAGGVAVMTNPLWHQNLAGATFLSPTGACKPFDAKADGYCRGEAITSVFLKRMSDAIKDGNTILGSIRSTGVFQNENCTPIFVPNAPSLSGLFDHVIDRAGLKPQDISLVEAHGTGTPVGDPAEYESIRRVMGGREIRSTPMPIGSIKGLVGHTECASGIVALIKILLLLHHEAIPPQASFDTLSPKIQASPDDMMQVVTRIMPWKADHRRAALLNNYGASGSNASMVISDPPFQVQKPASAILPSDTALPFWFTGFDERSIKQYVARFLGMLSSPKFTHKGSSLLGDLSYNLSRQSNRSLPKGLILSASSADQLKNELSSFVAGTSKNGLTDERTSRPVILCFGGQTSRTIFLHKDIFDANLLLQTHLNECDGLLQSQGLPSLYPYIFDNKPSDDPVQVQTALFSLQYASAKAWIDSGISVASVTGHSFGEFAALCIAGVLSLKDTITVVGRRARLVQSAWGSESGAMMAVEGSFLAVQELLKKATSSLTSIDAPASIACFNGPTSFTLAGSTSAIDSVELAIKDSAIVRGKRLSVTNAFHSALADPILEEMGRIAGGITFAAPQIPWARAIETESLGGEQIDQSFFPHHLRNPVYAHHAWQRLNQKFPSAIWLEAGSNSTITRMASKALGVPPDTSHFQAVDLSSPTSLSSTFINLWKQGLAASYWAHHASQARMYGTLLLPPYQFEKSRHWLELKKPQLQIARSIEVPTQAPPAPVGLFTFQGYEDAARRHARFEVNTRTKQYEDLVLGHVVAGTAAICPATVMIDMATEALLSINPEVKASNLQLEYYDTDNYAPLCVNPERLVWLTIETLEDRERSYLWSFQSKVNDSSKGPVTTHVKGRIDCHAATDRRRLADFAKYERLFKHQQCLDILNSSTPDDVIQGRNMYRIFAEIVDYRAPYQALQKLVGLGEFSAGCVVKAHSGKTWVDAHLTDAFSQVGGFWVNCMTDRPSTEMFIAAGFESWVRAPLDHATLSSQPEKGPSSWNVLAKHHKVSSKSYTTDIFVYDAASGALREVMTGIHYASIPKTSMIKTLQRFSPASGVTLVAGLKDNTAAVIDHTAEIPVMPVLANNDIVTVSTAAVQKPTAKAQPGSSDKNTSTVSAKAIRLALVSEILAELSGLELKDINAKSQLADIGIDSLMGMEMAHELEDKFKCTLNLDELASVLSVQDVVNCVAAALSDGSDESSEEDDFENDPTPASNRSDYFDRSSSSSSSITDYSDTEPGTPFEKIEKMDAKISSSTTNAGLQLSSSMILDVFGRVKLQTDQLIIDHKCDGYMDTIDPKHTQLCVALTLEAFETLGCNIKAAKAGETLSRIQHASQHSHLVRYLYDLLETDARLVTIDISTGVITRTPVTPPAKASLEIRDDLVKAYPEHAFAPKLAYYCGSRLVDILAGKLDGVRHIFGCDEGRELVSGLYGDALFNKMSYTQMIDVVRGLAERIKSSNGSGPLRILEMGAGTGGTTKYLAPALATLGIEVEYTFTDLAPSFVAAARRKFKDYPFMKFRAHDIEAVPADDLLQTQHLIIASNAIHATHNLTKSLTNVRKALRSDGFLMMLEMTEPLRWLDVAFGIFEGWWLFEDDRPHALSHESLWERELHRAGYGHVDWTDGHLAETKAQRVIIATASGSQLDRLPDPIKPTPVILDTQAQLLARKAAIDGYVKEHTATFSAPTPAISDQEALLLTKKSDHAKCVLVTGGTGSVGSHLVSQLLARSDVAKVVCLNRPVRRQESYARQLASFTSRKLDVPAEHMQNGRLEVFATDLSKPRLGMEDHEWNQLVSSVTHIIHNAWPMSGLRPLQGFESQFTVMRNLINLCNEACTATGRRMRFEFVSSIAVVGHQPLRTLRPLVPEERVEVDSVLNNGYGDAKYACELMLDATLHRFPAHFDATSVRLGQVAGSSQTGYWNAIEHFCFLVKSCQTLGAIPDFPGVLSWTPVDHVAGTLADLIFQEQPSEIRPIYHIDNPVRQPWSHLVRNVLAPTLGVPAAGVVDFREWIRRVRGFPGSVERDNPAYKVVDFLDESFERMSCGGLLLDTQEACKASATLAGVGPVPDEVVRKYVGYWKEIGFLS